VGASFLVAFAVLHEDRRRGSALLVWASAIFVSTLTTKQHYVVDGIAGMALAAMVWLTFARLMPDGEDTSTSPADSRAANAARRRAPIRS
jgi:membrane-associated phospholipid phosphatase